MQIKNNYDIYWGKETIKKMEQEFLTVNLEQLQKLMILQNK